ncbi:hypothetical protein [Arthrobacter roseus]|uniref:hypothetical protein n=1 Tax=Arthrobacter roseus TaxID=136274 RepID=UPI001962594D|nr:hypothetical protein [Arthrobacter roseus]MBM7848314.1 hypothetical protein [Arthrobacter roseus]
MSDRNDNEDAVWQDLVSRLSDDEQKPEPVDAAPQELPASERVRQIFDGQPTLSHHGPRDHIAPEEPADEKYVPDDLPPLGSGEPLVVLSWLAAAGGPLALLLLTILWPSAPMALTLGIIAAFLAGVGYLLSRLPRGRDYSNNDGAEV